MSRPKQILTWVGTFSAALGIGFVMQNGDAVAARFAPNEAPSTQLDGHADHDHVIDTSSAGFVFYPMPFDAPDLDIEGLRLAAIDISDEPSAVTASIAVAETDGCEIAITAAVGIAATVDIAVMAPCHENASFTVHHQGMLFSALTNEFGGSLLTVPALAQNAVFIAEFDDGAGVVVDVNVPELADYDRAVLQWQGNNEVQLHALEFGAAYGDEGHIWHASTGSAGANNEKLGGFLTQLGVQSVPEALIAEVYTFPTNLTDRRGTVILSAEVEVTAANCAREVAAQSIQLIPGFPAEAKDLTMTMPACEYIGDFIVLKNMFKDLTLAAR